MDEENAPALFKLATHWSAQRGSAAPTCGKPLAFRPMPDPSSISAQAGRLRLPACAEALQDAHLHKPWTLPPQGLAVFHGDKDTGRLSHYFLPRLLLEGKRVLMLDGANCADPRLLERLARQRRVPFAQFSRQIQIARAFTCFQLTELIARLPQLLTDFPAEVLIVTAFPELYYDEDVRDRDAQVAFEQALANLRRWARSGDFTSPDKRGTATGVSGLASHASARGGFAALKISATQGPVLALTVGLFSSATTFMPSPARRRFFEKVCAAGSEVWQFNSNAEGKARLVCTKRIVGLPGPKGSAEFLNSPLSPLGERGRG